MDKKNIFNQENYLIRYAQDLHMAFQTFEKDEGSQWEKQCQQIESAVTITNEIINYRYRHTRDTAFLLDHLSREISKTNNQTCGIFPTGELAVRLTKILTAKQSIQPRYRNLLESIQLFDNNKTHISAPNRTISLPSQVKGDDTKVFITHQSRQEEFSLEARAKFPQHTTLESYIDTQIYQIKSETYNREKFEILLQSIDNTTIENIVIETRPRDLSQFWSSEVELFKPSKTLIVFYYDVLQCEEIAQRLASPFVVSSGLSLNFLNLVIQAFENARIHLAGDSAYSFLYLWIRKSFPHRRFSVEFHDMSIELPHIPGVYCYWHPLNQHDPIRYAINILSETAMLSDKTTPMISKRYCSEWNRRVTQAGGNASNSLTYFHIGPATNKPKHSEIVELNFKPKKSQFRFVYAASLLPEWERALTVYKGILAFLRFIHSRTRHSLLIVNGSHHSEDEDVIFKEYMDYFSSNGDKSFYHRKIARDKLTCHLQTYDVHFNASLYRPIFKTYNAPARVTTLLSEGIPSVISRGLFSSDFESLLIDYSAGIVIDSLSPSNIQATENQEIEFMKRTLDELEQKLSNLEKYISGAYNLSQYLMRQNERLKQKWLGETEQVR